MNKMPSFDLHHWETAKLERYSSVRLGKQLLSSHTNTKELILLNCGVGEGSWEFPGLQGDQTINTKGNQSWIFIGSTDAEAETPILWPPDAKNWLTGKDPDTGKDWRQEKGTTEDELIVWHHQLDGHEFEQVPGVGDGQGGLVWCSLRGHKESDMTEWLNWTNWTEHKRTRKYKIQVWRSLFGRNNRTRAEPMTKEI